MSNEIIKLTSSEKRGIIIEAGMQAVPYVGASLLLLL